MTSPVSSPTLSPSSAPSSAPTSFLPICVDLDGTVVKRHALWAFHPKPMASAWQLLHLWKGRSWPVIKENIAQLGDMGNVEKLPYDNAVLSQLQQWHKRGRPLYLVTGAPPTIANAVAKHINLFQGVLCSTIVPPLNLVGAAKAALLKKRFGLYGYDYVGDSFKDRHVWRGARCCYVAPSAGWLASWWVRQWVQRHGKPHHQTVVFL